MSGAAVGGHGGSQGERGGLGSVLRDLVKPGDENLREMNKKLQNMLEEQLTKNMHLQKVTHTHTHMVFMSGLRCLVVMETNMFKVNMMSLLSAGPGGFVPGISPYQ